MCVIVYSSEPVWCVYVLVALREGLTWRLAYLFRGISEVKVA